MAAAGPVPGLRAGGFVWKPACFGACRAGCQRSGGMQTRMRPAGGLRRESFI